MRALARFVIRPTDDNMTTGDAIIGAMLREQDPDFLRPNQVYEIREVLDVLVIVPVGESMMGMYPPEATADVKSKSLISSTGWVNELGWVIDVGSGYHLVTREEWQRTLERRARETAKEDGGS
jgi:hypothetical protein